ncbi:MAG TPA: M20/M25/M40 family metallo-hydrolase [Pyrinomonadaceae bacterium]|nr:M20/M25/M40 family metallo-hydrolase [Pyrinomonadaceae bacterium]
MKRNFFALLLTFAVALSVAAQAIRVTPAERKLAEAITADQLKDYLYFVASDAMEGRDTPSRGLDVTAEFLKMNLSRWGFKPAGDNGTFFQKIELTVESIHAVNNILQVDGKSFALNNDFFRLRGNGSANALMVFAGNGWVVKSKNIDSYKGVDVRGRIVVLKADGFPHPTTLTSMPTSVTQADLTGTKGSDWSDPLTYATANGAAGILVIGPPDIQAPQQWERIARFFSRGDMYPTKFRTAPSDTESKLPVMYVNKPVADSILAGASGGIDSTTPFTIDKTVSMTTMGSKYSQWTQNVVALWEGGDPVLKQEMVAVGAHYDHVGTNLNATGEDKIWNGADDDGSGTVAVLSIAEALSKSRVRPKRSILLVWHAGEEKGLWGAEYFNKFPTVDIKKVIAQLNIDMIGRSLDPNNVIKCDSPGKRCNENLTKANEIYVIGSEMMSSTLGAVTKGTNNAFLKLNYNYKYDDPNDKEQFFFRSDHFHYAMNGIPIAFWFDGVHEDYHQPSDHADKIDYAKMEKVARTIFLTMWKLSALRERPKIDKQLAPALIRR